MDPRLVGSWSLEGVSTLLGRPAPEVSAEVWKPDRAGPRSRAAMRGVGFVFRADETGYSESRRDPRFVPRSRLPGESKRRKVGCLLSSPARIGRLAASASGFTPIGRRCCGLCARLWPTRRRPACWSETTQLPPAGERSPAEPSAAPDCGGM